MYKKFKEELTMARKKKGNNVNIDLSGVEAGFETIPEGQYTVVVDETEIKTSQNSGNEYISFTFEVSEGKHKGAKLFHNCSLQPQALFNLKQVLTALGFEIPNKGFDLDIEDLVGLECDVEVAHEKYEGKKKSRIVEFITDGEDNDDSDEEEEDSGDMEELLGELELEDLKAIAKELEIKLGKKDKAKAIIEKILDEDEEEVKAAYDEICGEEEDETDYSEMDLDELKAECKDRGIKFSKKAKKPELIELLEEDDEE